MLGEPIIFIRYFTQTCLSLAHKIREYLHPGVNICGNGEFRSPDRSYVLSSGGKQNKDRKYRKKYRGGNHSFVS